MAATITTPFNNRVKAGPEPASSGNGSAVIKIVGDSSYGTGGYDISAAVAALDPLGRTVTVTAFTAGVVGGLNTAEMDMTQGSETCIFNDPALQAEEAATTDVSGTTVYLQVFYTITG